MRRAPLVVFLGPSLSAPEARRITRCTVLPPARQGDVWRALALRPRAIALVDGLFESTPSVWHHELLDALDAGVAVFGGASMGALRAAELSRHGMVGVGRIHGWYRDGVVQGDDEVALLHAGAELGFRPLTLPLVNVRRAAELALEAGALTAREARALVAAGAAIFYQERTWKLVLAAGRPYLGPAVASKLRALFPGGPPDLKADDARATIEAAATFVRATGRAAVHAHPSRRGALGGLPPPRRPSALVRRRKLAEGHSIAAGRAVASSDVLAELQASPEATTLRELGLRRALLAGFARALGIAATEADREAAARELFAARGLPPRGRDAFLAESGLDGADTARLVEDLALERLLLDSAARAVPDGPSSDEGLALGARLTGRWAELARRLARVSFTKGLPRAKIERP
jgi:hypothetical protein